MQAYFGSIKSTTPVAVGATIAAAEENFNNSGGGSKTMRNEKRHENRNGWAIKLIALLFSFCFFFFAAKRPPVEETASFLQSLLASHGPNYLEKLFGSKARDALAPLGGVEKVAISLSESQTIEDFGSALHLLR